MFTGIVEALGTVSAVHDVPSGRTLHIACGFEGIVLGESIACDGICLTVTERPSGGFVVDASAETLARTTLGQRRTGDRLNLERALRAGSPISGHLVSGHIDGVATVARTSEVGDALHVVYQLPDEIVPLVAVKGSIAIDGVSLTVNDIEGARCSVMLIPFTRRETTLDTKPPGSRVNVEVDILARYVARLLACGGTA